MWTPSVQMGFLPDDDPILLLDSRYEELNSISADLPYLIQSKKLRQTLKDLPIYDLSHLTTKELKRAMVIYSYFASAYVFSRFEEPEKFIPKSVSIPLVWLSGFFERPPILSYDSYCLNNWKKKNSLGQIELANLELFQNFATEDEGKKDEDWFILVHVDIEARAAKAIDGTNDLLQLQKHPLSEINFNGALSKIKSGLVAMNQTMARMPENCSPDVYFEKVRPYIFSFENVVYENCFEDKPQSFRGETGAQSSVIPALISVMGIKHKDSILIRHLRDMRQYMPKPHRKYLCLLDNVGDWVRDSIYKISSQALKDLYNECLEQILIFRKTHLQYAVDYIHKKVNNPTGTGGTPYMQWLDNLISETEEYIFK